MYGKIIFAIFFALLLSCAEKNVAQQNSQMMRDIDMSYDGIDDFAGDVNESKVIGLGSMRCAGVTDERGFMQAERRALKNALKKIVRTTNFPNEIIDDPDVVISYSVTSKGFNGRFCKTTVNAIIDEDELRIRMGNKRDDVVISVAVGEFLRSEDAQNGETVYAGHSDRMNRALEGQMQDFGYMVRSPVEVVESIFTKEVFTRAHFRLREGNKKTLLKTALCQDGAPFLLTGKVISEEGNTPYDSGYNINVSTDLVLYETTSGRAISLASVLDQSIGRGDQREVANNRAFDNLARSVIRKIIPKLRRRPIDPDKIADRKASLCRR